MSSKLHLSAFPDRLKERRKSLGITQAELAAEVGTSVKTINSWETEVPKEGSGPKASNLISLCNALDCSFDFLFGGEKFPSSQHEAFFDSCGLSAAAYDKLKQYKRLSEKDHPIASGIGKQYLDLYSSFITDLSMSGFLDSFIGKYLRIRDKGLTVEEDKVFIDRKEALLFCQFELTREISGFVEKNFECFFSEDQEEGEGKNGID